MTIATDAVVIVIAGLILWIAAGYIKLLIEDDQIRNACRRMGWEEEEIDRMINGQ